MPNPDETILDIDSELPTSPSRLRSKEELAAEFPEQRRDLKCPDCGDRLVLRDGKFGIFYGCRLYRETGCRGVHNCHKKDAKPFGTPADAKTRKARKETHDWLTRLCKSDPFFSVPAAYKWLASQMSLSEEECHVGLFDLAKCERAVNAVRLRLNEFTRFDHIDREIL